MRRIYLDHAATTPVAPEVAEAVQQAMLADFGNPSSLHAFGREARRLVERARAEVAALIGARPAEVFFTSGGTESDNLALFGVAEEAGPDRQVVISAVEHHAVLHAAEELRRRGFPVAVIPVDPEGVIDLEALRAALRRPTSLVSVMLANNEVGVIQPVAEAARLAHEAGALCHTDAVQAAGQIPIDVGGLGVDLLSLTAHKIYGPKGVGALFVRSGVRLRPLLHGGGQERSLRPGTENAPGVAGLGKAAELARLHLAERAARNARRRDALLAGLREAIPGLRLNGHPVERLPNNLNVTIPGADGEALVVGLDLEGIAASTGSACSAGAVDPSHVLLAMGLSREEAGASLRLTFGEGNEEGDVERVLAALPAIVERIRGVTASRA